MENLNNTNNEITEFFENLNGSTQADASQRIFHKLNEVMAEDGENGLTNSGWEDALKHGYSQANPHSDEIFEYQPVNDGE